MAIAVIVLPVDLRAPGRHRVAASGQRVREKDIPTTHVVFAIVANFVILGAVIPLLAVTGRNRLSDYGIDGRDGEPRSVSAALAFCCHALRDRGAGGDGPGAGRRPNILT